MTTAEDLRRFAESNGLKIHPGQDLNNWVTEVLDEGCMSMYWTGMPMSAST